MNDLVQFLRNQYDIEASAAENAAAETGADWHYDSKSGYVLGGRDHDMVATGSQDFLEPSAGAHIARHDPARVLREVEAKRRILAVHRPYVPEPDQACLGCAGGIQFQFCPVVRLLGLPYADHPEYRDAWRP
ncbi:DUF6221 family protein [Streptomyces parvus]|uniref:DUF6221 family protein n=1 Tax=Streptomyces parvus TaxID=66428 RepID=UPI0033C5B6E9